MNLRNFAIYAGLVVGSCVAVEAVSFVVLAWRETRAGKTWGTAARELRLKHPANLARHAYGGYDPVNTQFLAPNSTYNNLKTNRWGFIANTDEAKDPAVFPGKAPGTLRVVLLGGSSMAGAGASRNSETISAHLERLLLEQGLNAEVFNYGMFGDATYGEMTRLIGEAVYIKPNVVVCMDGWNDIVASVEWSRQKLPHSALNWHSLSYQYFNYFHGLNERARMPPALFTYAWILVDNVISTDEPSPENRRLEAYERLPSYRLSGIYAADADYPGSVYAVNLSAMASFAAANGIAFVHYLQPHPDYAKKLTAEEDEKIGGDFAKYAQDWGEIFSRARFLQSLEHGYGQFRKHDAALRNRFASDARVRFFDLTELFVGTPQRVYDDVIHYNDLGNKIIAQRMAADILKLESMR